MAPAKWIYALSDGTKVPGEIVGADTFSDIAVVKISSEKVTTVAEFGDSSKLTVGENCYCYR